MTYFLRLALGSLLLTGCGLTLDTSPPDDAAQSPPGADAGMGPADAGDGVDAFVPPPDDAGAPPVDAARPDANVMDPDGGCVDRDADDDGWGTCAGDCDDADPTVHPGAPMICGDGVDNACAGDADEEACMGIGTYVSVRGDDTNPGTQARPVRTIAQGLVNATRIGGGVDVYVAGGDYAEDVVMVDGVSVYCGFEPDAWDRDWTVHVTTIQPRSDLGVSFPSGTGRETVLHGCVVEGRGERATSYAVSFDAGSSGAVRACTIVGGDNPSGMSVGVGVYPSGSDASSPENRGRPLVADSDVRMGRANLWGRGTPATSNGILVNRSNVELYRNRIELVSQQTVQRGILLRFPLAGAKAEDNRIRPSGAVRSEHAAGILVVGGQAEIAGNDVFTGHCQRWCIGVEVLQLPGGLFITNNQIYAGESEGELSAGVLFELEGDSDGDVTGDVLVHSNLIVGAAEGNPATGIGWLNESPTRLVAGRIMSNIVYGGSGSNGHAMWEANDRYDPERLEANMMWRSSATGVTGGLYYDEGLYPLSSILALIGLTEHTGVASQEIDCEVRDPRPDGDPHLSAGSPCIDQGTTEEAPAFDIDGETRPMGRSADPGVDEVPG